MFNASLFAASILPISTSYAVCEGLGFESGLDKKFHEAPVFYWLYTVLIALGAAFVLIPRLPLVYVTVLSQAVNGMVLPLVLVFMLLLTNDRERRAPQHGPEILDAFNERPDRVELLEQRPGAQLVDVGDRVAELVSELDKSL